MSELLFTLLCDLYWYCATDLSFNPLDWGNLTLLMIHVAIGTFWSRYVRLEGDV